MDPLICCNINWFPSFYSQPPVVSSLLSSKRHLVKTRAKSCPSSAPTSEKKLKTQALPPRPHLVWPLLPPWLNFRYFLLLPIQPHWLPHCSSNTPGMVQPQGLCTCSVCLGALLLALCVAPSLSAFKSLIKCLLREALLLSSC